MPRVASREALLPGVLGIEQTVELIRGKIWSGMRLWSVQQDARRIVARVAPHDIGGQIHAVFDSFVDPGAVPYRKDPTGVELVQDADVYPHAKGGDCDDITVRAGALLESLGIPVQVVIGSRKPGVGGLPRYHHVWIRAYDPDKRAWVPFDPVLYDPRKRPDADLGDEMPRIAQRVWSMNARPKPTAIRARVVPRPTASTAMRIAATALFPAPMLAAQLVKVARAKLAKRPAPKPAPRPAARPVAVARPVPARRPSAVVTARVVNSRPSPVAPKPSAPAAAPPEAYDEEQPDQAEQTDEALEPETESERDEGGGEESLEAIAGMSAAEYEELAGDVLGGPFDFLQKVGKAIDPQYNPLTRAFVANVVPGGGAALTAWSAVSKIRDTVQAASKPAPKPAPVPVPGPAPVPAAPPRAPALSVRPPMPAFTPVAAGPQALTVAAPVQTSAQPAGWSTGKKVAAGAAGVAVVGLGIFALTRRKRGRR